MKAKKFGLALILALAVIVLSPWVRFYFLGHSITAKVVAFDHVKDCNPGFGPGFIYESDGYLAYDGNRTAEASVYLGECGGVDTEYGYYHVVGSYLWWGPNMSRAEIIRNMRVGCTYEMRIVGQGPPQDEGPSWQLELEQSIWKLELIGEC